MKPEVTSFFHEDTNTFSYVVKNPDNHGAVVIDPVLDFDYKAARTWTDTADGILEFIRKEGLAVEWILETHAHADHLSAAPYLAKALGAKIAIGEGIQQVQGRFIKVFNLPNEHQPNGSEFDHLLKDGEIFETAGMKIEVMHTPGHTSDSNSFLVGDAVFVGDTLFMPDAGSARADFPGGDAGMLYDSMQKLLSLPDETRMFMCHDYAPGGREIKNETTVAEQKARNIHAGAGVSRDDYVKMREERDATLPMPRLIIPSVQINMRAGKLPPPEDNDVSYLKVPLNLLGPKPGERSGHD
ncbi:glyoxylase-like metal-dependent hydrolase (beta-lactamase superfamily II) [Natronospira proteinivora]|uniref:Glyoxylase-like metal-dependent hydrolase (Beta-lactamase superfamily II) n=1 Tax=Natronospira proteinivora TaxID=1807133 RepID=A0ABT1G6V3_9GAMM|nr:MBL fold metallo-hydrolase [Natronospira proteinivora]MCP1727034.1 glyoxylase-like metal-dependent hydrolase (beta-lactamase superfamily II) [Natronospira proteinivora]